ncbi:MAG: hypothetical protein D6703_01420 [Zetaproteobacteria bacterium]|nr:MAG: hypothetical protein D6703_01420 [Zetaproteobacteria bacterium]
MLFFWRGVRQWQGRPVFHRLGRRIVPDTIDTLLLLSGLAMALRLQQYPFAASWMTIKLILVAVYIVLGFVAFRMDGHMRWRRAAWLGALLVFAGILGIVMAHLTGDF